MEGKGRRNEKITAVILLGFTLLYSYGSLRLKLGSFKYPGPGLFPVVIGGLLVVCSIFYLVRAFRARPPGAANADAAMGKEMNYRVIIGIVACTILYPFILEMLKFVISTTMVAFVMLFLLKPQRAVFSFLLALGMAIVSFLVFYRLLGVALPSGFLEDFLFRIGR